MAALTDKQREFLDQPYVGEVTTLRDDGSPHTTVVWVDTDTDGFDEYRLALVLCDVGPRDGLQNEPETLEPAVRADLVNRLAAAGLPRIEAVSFVRADRVPQMAGAEEVVAGIDPLSRKGTEYSGLVLNEQGYER